jgi:thiol-disulfide isomerase/thioredoxin
MGKFNRIKNSLIRCFLVSGMLLLVSSLTYSQPRKVPPFQIIQANGKVFLAGNLPMGKPIVIIYFSPDCEECHDFTTELLTRIKEFNNTSIAMITNMPIDQVKQFVSEFQMGKYPNIYIGTEGYSFFVGRYYGVGKLPFVALHNKNGDLIKVYNEELSIEDLLLNLRGL